MELRLCNQQKQSILNEDENNRIHFIQHEMIKLGYDLFLVNQVISNFPISSTEQVISYLKKTDGFWNHVFIPQKEKETKPETYDLIMSSAISFLHSKPSKEVCEICGDPRTQHRFARSKSMDNNTKEITLISLKKQENEMIASKECGICINEYDNPILIPPCNHTFCTECFYCYIRNLITNNQIDRIKCPQSNCFNELKEDFFLNNLSNDFLKKYYLFKNKNMINQDANKISCPFCNSYGVVNQVNNKNKSIITCSNNHSFCSCGRKEHTDLCFKEDKALSKYIVKEKIKQCPKCGFLIKKNDGCNHMTCGNPGCRYQFCWICLQEYKVDHYIQGPCQGMQFIDTKGIRFRNRENPRTYACLTCLTDVGEWLLMGLFCLILFVCPVIFIGLLLLTLFVFEEQRMLPEVKVSMNPLFVDISYIVIILLISIGLTPLYYMLLALAICIMIISWTGFGIYILIDTLCPCCDCCSCCGNCDLCCCFDCFKSSDYEDDLV